VFWAQEEEIEPEKDELMTHRTAWTALNINTARV